MQSLMQKPWFVALLCVAAVAAVYINVVQPMMGHYSFFSQRSKAAAVPAVPAPRSVQQQNADAQKNTDWAALAAVKNVGNPFHEYREQAVAASVEHVISPEDREPAWPRVSAVAITSGGRFAVVDGHVMHEGEALNGFRFSKVTAQYVILTFGTHTKKIKVQSGGSRDE
ncbi:hypothetical protein FE236_10215 [Mariprofundus erugo]|uniref:Uncharacterized protein n=1 Tax=Mariprofundus erugo TaxID=2528639 RepID=A0A5R9GSN5_9PROT|nr:hypothetical protein [Mariprofundus erugo]TLS69191.1 hypothetical protein FEF65_01525 [Mariprofundus erugo]TLS75025.1 hypothetical protein FE236_10215 [Mariprofundus erugo]